MNCLLMDPPYDSIKTTMWYGNVKFSNNIVAKRFYKRINDRLTICRSFIKDYYRSHNRLDIAYDAIGKLDGYSLLLLCKYVYDVDRAIAFSSTARMKYFYRYISRVTSTIYSSLKNELGNEIARYSLGFIFFVCGVIFVYDCIYTRQD